MQVTVNLGMIIRAIRIPGTITAITMSEQPARLQDIREIRSEDVSGGTGLVRLMTWLSPSFPVGAYSYSHGLEWDSVD